jgi:hypothetical protein
MKTCNYKLNSTASARRCCWERLISSQLFCVFALTLIFLSGASRANASIIDYIYQSGSNVISTYSGTINTAALTSAGSGACTPVIAPSSAFECFDSSGSPAVPLLTGFTGPTSFGAGSNTAATSQSGDFFAINGSGHLLSVYSGYAGTAISGTLEWDSSTIAGLGLTTGTYTYTWGSGATADSIVLEVGVAPVPEPSSLGLLLLAFAGLAVLLRSRRASNV